MMFNNLFEFYLSEFRKFGEPYLKTIANCMVPSKIVRQKYKQIDPIENLSIDKKKELWEYAGECFPDETKVFKIRFCIIVHTIGSLA